MYQLESRLFAFLEANNKHSSNFRLYSINSGISILNNTNTTINLISSYYIYEF